MKRLLNLTCPACGAPLIQLEAIKGREGTLASYGCSFRADEANPSTLYAVCNTCRAETPFDAALLPSRPAE